MSTTDDDDEKGVSDFFEKEERTRVFSLTTGEMVDMCKKLALCHKNQ